MRSHSEVLSVKTSIYLFEDTIQPITEIKSTIYQTKPSSEVLHFKQKLAHKTVDLKRKPKNLLEKIFSMQDYVYLEKTII